MIYVINNIIDEIYGKKNKTYQNLYSFVSYKVTQQTLMVK